MNKKIIFLPLYLFLTNVSFAQSTDKLSWMGITDTTYHFSFSYPINWELKLPNTNTRFFVTSYPENSADKIRENVNFAAKELNTVNFKIQSAEEAIKNNLAQKLQNFKLIDSKYFQWNSTDVLVFEFTCTKMVNDTPVTLRLQTYQAILGKWLYTFTFTAEDASYNKYMEVAAKIFNSIKFQAYF